MFLGGTADMENIYYEGIRRSKRRRKKGPVILILLLLAAAIGFGGYKLAGMLLEKEAFKARSCMVFVCSSVISAGHVSMVEPA